MDSGPWSLSPSPWPRASVLSWPTGDEQVPLWRQDHPILSSWVAASSPAFLWGCLKQRQPSQVEGSKAPSMGEAEEGGGAQRQGEERVTHPVLYASQEMACAQQQARPGVAWTWEAEVETQPPCFNSESSRG